MLSGGANLRRCLLLVIAGAAAVVAVGWLLGLFVPYPVVAATNAQVAARVTLQIADLVAALATGAVALCHDLNTAGLSGLDVRVSLIPASYKLLPGQGSASRGRRSPRSPAPGSSRPHAG